MLWTKHLKQRIEKRLFRHSENDDLLRFSGPHSRSMSPTPSGVSAPISVPKIYQSPPATDAWGHGFAHSECAPSQWRQCVLDQKISSVGFLIPRSSHRHLRGYLGWFDDAAQPCWLQACANVRNDTFDVKGWRIMEGDCASMIHSSDYIFVYGLYIINFMYTVSYISCAFAINRSFCRQVSPTKYQQWPNVQET